MGSFSLSLSLSALKKRERETLICCYTYLCIHWLIFVCALAKRMGQATLVYQNNTLTNWATWPGLGHFLKIAVPVPLWKSVCVVTIQGRTSTCNLGSLKNIHRAIGMSDMRLVTGGRSTQTTSCMSPCMLLSVALQHGTLHVTCFLMWHILWYPVMSPYPLNTRTQIKPAGCQQILCNRASYYACEPTQGYENTAYQAHSHGYGKLLSLVA